MNTTAKHGATTRRTVVEIASGLGSALLLIAVVIGLPLGLYLVAGIPWPHHTTSPGQITHALTQRDNGQLFLSVLLAVAWIAWATFAISVIVEGAALIRGTAAPRLPGCAVSQHAAAALLAAVAVLLISAPRVGAPASVSPTPSPQRIQTTAFQLPASNERAAGPSTPTNRATGAAEYATYIVRRGDTLWSIAETHLGDPERWREIARLNYDRPQPGGQALTSAHWIYPGWHLLLPHTHAAATAGPNRTAAPVRLHRSTSAPQPRNAAHAPAAAPSAPRAGQARPDAAPSATSDSPVPTRRRPDARPVPATSTKETDHATAPEIGAALAAGILAALAAARLRQRRAYSPRPVAPATIPTGPPPDPLRTLLATTRRGPRDEDTDDDENDLNADLDEPTGPRPAAPVPQPAGVDLVPGTVEAGTRGGQPVMLSLADWPGLTLHGSVADDVARAWIASLLAHVGPPGHELLVATHTCDRLLPGIPATASLSVLPDADGLLLHLEAEQLRRSRLLADVDASNITVLHLGSPEDPLPFITAVLDPVATERAARWNVLQASAGRLGIAVVIIDSGGEPSGSGPVLQLAADATAASATPAQLEGITAGARMFHLSAAELAVLLAPILGSSGLSSPAPVPESAPTAPRDEEMASADAAVRVPVSSAAAPVWPARLGPDQNAAITVRLLGPMTVTAWGREIKTGLRDSARELLAWYLLRPDGAPAEAAIDALWPDVPAERGPQRFWNALGNLRSRLHGPSGEHVEILTKVGDRYRPCVKEIECDLWRFQHALHLAASEPAESTAVLAEVAQLYSGDFIGTASYLWVDPIREELHRRALDVHVRLAELHDEHGDTEAAVQVLERAIALDPVAEDLYRRLIRLLVQAGRPDGVDRLWAQLNGRLADIDAEPDKRTIDLIHHVRKRIPAPTA